MILVIQGGLTRAVVRSSGVKRVERYGRAKHDPSGGPRVEIG